MITSLTVKNFRNLRSVTMERLGRFTLIGGKNGVGKTALLEAVWLLSGADLPELGPRVDTFRGLPPFGPENVFRDIFRDFKTNQRITVSANGDWGNRSRRLDVYIQERSQVDSIRSAAAEGVAIGQLSRPQDEGEEYLVFEYRHKDGNTYTSRGWWIAEQLTQAVPGGSVLSSQGVRQAREMVPGRPTSVFMPALHRQDLQTSATRLGELQLEGEEERILSLLTPLEPRLERLNTITLKNTPVIHAYIDGRDRPIPVQLLGEGFNRMLGLALAMHEAAGGLVLIDEIENGLHYSVHQEVFSTLMQLADAFDVQILATTHSAECIRAAYEAVGRKYEKEFAFYRLTSVEDDVKATPFYGEKIETAVEFNMEIR